MVDETAFYVLITLTTTFSMVMSHPPSLYMRKTASSNRGFHPIAVLEGLRLTSTKVILTPSSTGVEPHFKLTDHAQIESLVYSVGS
ncbi:hypothetical protein BDD12DRAFT_856513 [Trichophaea hybrida]|nr:hypothetical protein BDD12DRAFT_856513 [Trichophaea hybrida]